MGFTKIVLWIGILFLTVGCAQTMQVKISVKEGASGNNATAMFMVFAKEKDLPVELGTKEEFFRKYEKAEFSHESTKVIKTPITRKEFLENVLFFNAEDFVVVKCVIASEPNLYEFLLEFVEDYPRVRLFLPTEHPVNLDLEYDYITISCEKTRIYLEKKE